MKPIEERFTMLDRALDSMHLKFKFCDTKLNSFLWDIYGKLLEIERTHMEEHPNNEEHPNAENMKIGNISSIKERILPNNDNTEYIVRNGEQAMEMIENITNIYSDFNDSREHINIMLDSLTRFLELNRDEEIDVHSIKNLSLTAARKWNIFHELHVDRINKLGVQLSCLVHTLYNVLQIIINRSFYYEKNYETMLHSNWKH